MNYINEFINYLKVLRKYSKNTLKNYQNDLLELYDFDTDVLNIKEKEVEEYLEYLYSRGLNRNSISRKLSAIRSFYNYLIKEEVIQINYFDEISNPKKNRSLPHYIKNNDLEIMFHSFKDQNKIEIRNHCILEVLYATGIRVSELVNIKINDIDFYNNTIKILGKGNKERIVIFGSYAKNIIEKYLNHSRDKFLKGKTNEYLFLNKNGTKLTTRYIRIILNDIVKKCEIDYHISPHTLRHTFATDMLNSGADLMTVKELLGHSSVNTTGIYTHITNEQIKKVYSFAHPRAKE